MRLFVTIVLGLGFCGCAGRMLPMDGTWERAGISGDHFGIVVMTLRQDGRQVTGMACRTSSGHLGFRDAPVTGENPDVSFAYYADRIEASITSENLVVAVRMRDGAPQERWYFHRVPREEYDTCAAARP